MCARGQLGAKRQNIVFPFFSRATMARRGASGVFRKNTPPPLRLLPAACRSVFFPPFCSVSATIVISCSYGERARFANFETKTPAESKTKLVLCLFAVAKQGRCKTTIKTILRVENTFHQSYQRFSFLSPCFRPFCFTFCLAKIDRDESHASSILFYRDKRARAL